MNNIDKFIDRLRKLGIVVTIHGNLPWLYLTSVNGVEVEEKYRSPYGFTLGLALTDGVKFSDLSIVFGIIRKYVAISKMGLLDRGRPWVDKRMEVIAKLSKLVG